MFEWREGPIWSVAFTADGSTLVAAAQEGQLRAWPLSAESASAFQVLPKMDTFAMNSAVPMIAASPTRGEVVVAAARGQVRVMPIDGGVPRELDGFPKEGAFWGAVAISPDGRRAGAALFTGPMKGKRIHVWDLQTGALQVLEPVPKADDWLEGGFTGLSFVDNDRIVATVIGNGLMLFDLRDGKGKVLAPAINAGLAMGRSGRVGVGTAWDGKSPSLEVFRFGLDGSAPVPLPYQARGFASLALDPTETIIASAGAEGTIQVGPISGGEPHLLFGHKGGVKQLAFSPDGKWLASAGDDQTVRLWPVPDMKEVPPHKRSHEEFPRDASHLHQRSRGVRRQFAQRLEARDRTFPGWKTAPHW